MYKFARGRVQKRFSCGAATHRCELITALTLQWAPIMIGTQLGGPALTTAILGITADGWHHHQCPPSPFWAQPSAVVSPKPWELCRVSWAFPCTPSAWEMSRECLELYYSQVWVSVSIIRGAILF